MAETQRTLKLRARHGLQVEGSQVWVTGFTRDTSGRMQVCLSTTSPGPVAILKPLREDIDDPEGAK